MISYNIRGISLYQLSVNFHIHWSVKFVDILNQFALKNVYTPAKVNPKSTITPAQEIQPTYPVSKTQLTTSRHLKTLPIPLSPGFNFPRQWASSRRDE